ncbi:cytochrome c-type biogenesis protein [Taklimakanibacter lacteus]|uniref:cytochrome c-type biogenesis protein n=1 Tax=Taklimakanibacter lacteus TaxID=2268456 RepID=UPI000E66076A
MRNLFTAFILLVALASPLRAVQPDEILPDPALEERARALSTNLRCLVCQNQSIDDSNAPLARDLRILLRERLKAGDSDDQAVDFIVARYGDFVLLRPRFTPETWILWIGPFVLLLGAGALLYLRRKRPEETAEGELSNEERAALAQRLGTDQP